VAAAAPAAAAAAADAVAAAEERGMVEVVTGVAEAVADAADMGVGDQDHQSRRMKRSLQ